MAGTPPPIDARTYEDLVARTEALATQYSGWTPGNRDPGSALIRVFARMLSHVLERLNRVPDKHRLAFLELLGASRQPPRAARVPLTFHLAPGATGATVPQGTSVSGDEGLPFETEQALTLTRSKLTDLLVREPRTTQNAERSSDLGPAPSEPFPACVGEHVVEHALYLACDALFTQPGATERWLELTWKQPPATDIDWSFWNGRAWQPLSASEPAGNPVWRLGLQGLDPSPRELRGRTARWLRGVPRVPSSSLWLQGIRTHVAVRRSGVVPERAFHNTVPLDLSRELLPFGEQPRFNDAFYLSHRDVLRPGGDGSKPRRIRLSAVWNTSAPWQKAPTEVVKATLAWEVWNGTGWVELGRSNQDGGIAPFVDTTKAFTQGGVVELQLPGDLQETSVNGTPGRWLRIRLVGGDYTTADKSPRPPALTSLTLDYEDTLNPPVEASLSNNDGAWEELTAALARPEGVAPFRVAPDTGPALYLGFDRPFGDLPVSLFVRVEPPRPEEVAASDSRTSLALAERPRLAWEYRSASGWSPLLVEDETQAFSRGGLVRFTGPAGHVQGTEFGRTCFWLRTRWLSASAPHAVRLRGVVLNTVWASQASTVTDEVLGSSTATPAQTFTAARTPLLEDFQLEVHEDTWVRWEAVPDFLASGPGDRHYTLDVESGEVRFGDGVQGMIPPAGTDNVRLSYRSGGGASGNVPAGTITRLDTSIPSVASVSQPEPATGGADLEPLSLLAERQARSLRHGGRAVTAEDFEDLAREASTAIARVRAIPPTFDPISQADAPNPVGTRAGQVLLVIVPHGTAPKPTPSLELLRQVEDHVRARCAPVTQLQVGGPTWVEAHVQTHLLPRQLAEGEAMRARAREALARYLHPLIGGPDGDGWDFGQWPNASELVALLSRVEGVDHVVSVSIQRPVGAPSPGPATLLFVAAENITVSLASGEE